MKIVIPALAVALVATLGASSAAQAAVINFGVAAVTGADLSYTSPSTLNASTAFNFDGSPLLVVSIGPGDASGLTPFPGANNSVTLSPTDIVYGMTAGPLGSDVTKSWSNASGTDSFTETLTTVKEIDRDTPDAITVTLTGTLTDTAGLFTDAPVEFILSANQVRGPGTAIIAGFTNTTTVPEPATWVMLALGFAGLGYVGVRRNAKDKVAMAV